MKNECSYVRDVLPLYFENMVSEDTAAFVEEHLKTCPGCFSELEAMRAETKTEKQDGVTARALDGEALELKCDQASLQAGPWSIEGDVLTLTLDDSVHQYQRQTESPSA